MAQIIHELQDLSYLSWTLVRSSSGTGGSFMKSQEETAQGKIYYKLSDFNPVEGIVGHESVNEIIADRLLTILGIEHLEYTLIHAKIIIDSRPFETWLCASENFRKRGESKSALDDYYRLERSSPKESAMDFCLRMGWGKNIYQMLVFDYLILNRDRHGANMEVLQNVHNKTIRLAPLFDHGVSLFCRCKDEEALEKEDVLDDKQVQCYLGGRSAYQNLLLIPKDADIGISPLLEEHKNVLLDGLDGIIGKRWQERIWDMIWRRWQTYEDLRNQKR